MLASTRWINDYLDRPASDEEQAELLTRAGFPLEGREEIPISDGTDVRQDFEMTSNRGDCTCHLGLAREIAAISGRALKTPEIALPPAGAPVTEFVDVVNEAPDRCPRYTARVIRGVTVKPSPQWLQDRLIARGDIPRNNVVDATNFVLFEFGQPTHVFDLAKIKGNRLVIRSARDGEAFLPLGEGAEPIALVTDDLVIADAEDAVALAGVKGGALSAVTEETVDIVLEAATFHPVAVRTASRRHKIASDSSYRFERGVHPAAIERAADRLAALILELAGGELADGVIATGTEIPAAPTVTMRTDRCRRILGVEVSDEQMVTFLDTLEFAPQLADGVITCTVPNHRLDIEREIDVIEEVGRMFGHDNIPIADTISVRVAPPQPTELARRAVGQLLVGEGFLETCTHSLITDAAAEAFLPPGLTTLRVDDERAKAEPVLRPSVLPSLLRVAAHNRDQGNGDVRLFESAATFARTDDGHLETVNLAFVHPAAGDEPLRATRGIVERLVRLLRGPDATVEIAPMDHFPWLAPGAAVHYDGAILGTYGMLATSVAETFDLRTPYCVAELGVPKLYDVFPPETEAHALPAFPAIERDLSAIVDEAVTWSDITRTVTALDLQDLDGVDFVTTYRGKGIDTGRKSLTLRLRFRAADRTLTHDEVDGAVDAAIAALTRDVGAEIRS